MKNQTLKICILVFYVIFTYIGYAQQANTGNESLLGAKKSRERMITQESSKTSAEPVVTGGKKSPKKKGDEPQLIGSETGGKKVRNSTK